MREALYFGCLNDAGHFLHRRGDIVRIWRPQDVFPGFPWKIGMLDGGLLKNGRVPDVPDGRVHWTCGGRNEFWFGFVWWDRSGDKRSGSNSGFYVRGFPSTAVANAFDFACQTWPDVIARQQHPLMLEL
jgi:hypothetical protein